MAAGDWRQPGAGGRIFHTEDADGYLPQAAAFARADYSHSSGLKRRVRLIEPRRFFSSTRAALEVTVGRVSLYLESTPGQSGIDYGNLYCNED